LGLAKSTDETRMVYEFSTHNELVPAFPYDLGFGVTGGPVRCNGWLKASET